MEKRGRVDDIDFIRENSDKLGIIIEYVRSDESSLEFVTVVEEVVADIEEVLTDI